MLPVVAGSAATQMEISNASASEDPTQPATKRVRGAAEAALITSPLGHADEAALYEMISRERQARLKVLGVSDDAIEASELKHRIPGSGPGQVRSMRISGVPLFVPQFACLPPCPFRERKGRISLTLLPLPQIRLMQFNVLANGLAHDGFLVPPVLEVQSRHLDALRSCPSLFCFPHDLPGQ